MLLHRAMHRSLLSHKIPYTSNSARAFFGSVCGESISADQTKGLRGGFADAGHTRVSKLCFHLVHGIFWAAAMFALL